MIAIISDIHGNYPALKAVLDDIDNRNIKNIICLGDTSGYYCMINECIDALVERNIFSLKGNHDYYLISGEGCPRSNSANSCLEYQMSILKPNNKIWLENLRSSSLIIDDKHFVHGGWNDELDEYLYEVSKDYFQNRNGKYFFSGHTHVPIIFNMKNKIYCNPGSVGQPRDGNPKSSYAIFNNGKVENVRVNYDIDVIAFYMKKSGFDKYFYENLYLGSKIGGEIAATFVMR
ncbi:metallophosphoesterase family protein [Solibacillus daqui]|uniref:metallophosphoesterase family protein n=1 Tax=Solibacillus daqui TaxID=2912187 RepID=UPI002365C2D8|nr:metallophosphoesterase family protein [Solibacillus daqui]